MARWTIDLDDYFDEAEQNLVDDFRSIAFELLASVLRLTPVDTGRLRSAWFITLDRPGFGEENNNHGASALTQMTLTSRVILQNNVEYGPYVNSGTERMAGQFFVERAIEPFASQDIAGV